MKKNNKDKELYLKFTMLSHAKFIKMFFDLENEIELYDTKIIDCNITKNKSNYKNSEFLNIELKKELEEVDINNSKSIKTLTSEFGERFGMLLMRFLNADFSNFYTAYNTFLFAYGIDELIDVEGKRIDMSIDMNLNNILKWYSYMQKFFIGFQKYFRECVNYVYNLHSDDRDKEFSYISKLRAFTLLEPNMNMLQNSYEVSIKNIVSKDVPSNTSLHKLANLIENKDIEVNNIITYNTFNGWFTLLYRSLELITLRNTMPIKTCENDGKYFIPINRSDEIYCDYKHLDGSTCKDIGAKKKYAQKAQQNPAISAYNKIYQVKIMRARRNPDNNKLKEQFEKFKLRGTALKKAYLANQITLEEYNKLLEVIANDETNNEIEKFL